MGRPAAERPAGGGGAAGVGAGAVGAGIDTESDIERNTAAGGGDADRDAVEALLDGAGERLRARMARIELHLERVTAAAGAPLAVYASATILAGGKRLRPLLVVLAAEAAEAAEAAGATRDAEAGATRDAESDGPGRDGVAAEEHLTRAAVAVELVHSATLVHDDVIDAAPLRRGLPTVVADAGRETAVATGDLLFSRAFAELARNDDPVQLRALSDASSALAAGELLQREDAYAPRVALARYLRRCELKTAALFEAACRLGALAAAGASGAAGARAGGAGVAAIASAAGRGSTDLADALGLFARRIGLAFQILDDVLDISGPVERTGKARGTDLLDGTVTLPLILARERDAALAEVDLRGLYGPGGAQRAEELCDRIAATGALEAARARALDAVAEAKVALPANLPADRAASLERVADAVVERYS